MTVRVITPPAYEPVSLAEARLWCLEDADRTSQDPVLRLLIQAAREYAENLTARAFIQRGLQLVLPCWTTILVDGLYRTGIVLPFPPFASVESIKYIDEDGVEQTLSTSLYDAHTWREPGVIVPHWNEVWPSHRGVPDAIRVNYTAGYAYGSPSGEADQQSVLPASLKLWMQARIATLFENREQLITANQVKIPEHFCDGILDSLKIGHLFG